MVHGASRNIVGNNWYSFRKKEPDHGEIVIVYHSDAVVDHYDPPYWAFRPVRWDQKMPDKEDFFDKFWIKMKVPEEVLC